MENKVANLLPRIVALEERFDTRPSNVAEQRRRNDLIRYATVLPFLPSAHFLAASSMLSRNNCDCPKGRSCLCLLVTPKPMGAPPSSSKPSKRQFSTIRFVHDLKPDALPNIDWDNRWRNVWRLTIRDSDR